MLALGLILNTLGIGLFCWLVFMLAVYALPFFVGLGAGLAALHSGAGITGALVAGFATAALMVTFGRVTLVVAPSTVLRAVIGASFVVPAGIAGYCLVFGISQFAVPSLLWREIFALFGATFIAVTTGRGSTRPQIRARWNRMGFCATNLTQPCEVLATGTVLLLTVVSVCLYPALAGSSRCLAKPPPSAHDRRTPDPFGSICV
jgi:hypothetical protein